jgi:5,10-methylenetetrahydromethanopterin reductase
MIDKLSASQELIGLSYVIAQGPNTAGEMVGAAKLAEECGFYSVFVPEHYYDREGLSILGAIAQSTKSIRIGTGVINPYTRYPSLVAMTIATLDELSGGRAILGLGSGGVIGSLEHGIPNEFAGQEFNRPLGHIREMIGLVRRLLTGESVTFHGEFYSLDNVGLHFKPIQEHIPIYLGQQGPKMMDLAGEVTDGVLITLCCTTPYVKEVIKRIGISEELHHRAKGSVDFSARIIVSMDEDRSKAIETSKQLVGRVFIHPGSKPVMEASSFNLPIGDMKKAIDGGRSELLNDLIPDQIVEMTTASGTKSDVIRRVEEFRAAGVTHPLIVPIGKNFTEIIRAFR